MTEPTDHDALRALEAAATPGPWKRYGMAGVAGPDWEIVDERRVECDCGEPVALTGCVTNADAAFIAAARNAVPALLAENADLRGRLAAVEALADEPVAPYPAECSCSHGMGSCRYASNLPKSAIRAALATKADQ